MINKRRLRSAKPVVIVGVALLSLCGGCAPVDAASLETFVRETLRHAAAALLL